MNMEQLIENDQLKYRKPISIVNRYLNYYGVKPKSKINITPLWPYGWRGEVVVDDKVWTIECNRGQINSTKVGDYCSTMPNGVFIQKNVEHLISPGFFIKKRWTRRGNMVPSTCKNWGYDELECKCRFCNLKEKNYGHATVNKK